MKLRCPGCGKTVTVPEDKAANPGLRVKCGGCAAVFGLAEAGLVLAGLDPPAPAPASASAPPPARPAEARAGAASTPSAPSARPRPAAGPVSWRRCVNHPQTRSTSVCPPCKKGYCQDCGQPLPNAVGCPACDGLCVPAARYEERVAREAQRARPMSAELRTILAYPFVDRLAYLLLAVFTGFFALFAGFGGIAILLSKGVQMMYAFSAVARVSGGDLKDFKPEFRDISDLVGPLRLGLAALIVSAGPLFVVALLNPDLSFASLFSSGSEAASPLGPLPVPSPDAAPTLPPALQGLEGLGGEGAGEPGAEPEEGSVPEQEEAPGPEPTPFPEEAPSAARSLGRLALLVGSFAWMIVYTPVALIVAALTRSFFQTLNPLVGAGAIVRMGGVYWHAAAIYTVLAALQWGLGYPLTLVPIAGTMVRAFIDAYAFLAIGCTLGLAVFKKAPELGLE